MSRIGAVVLCAALTLPVVLGGCVAPLAVQALSSGLPLMGSQSIQSSLDALGRQLDGMVKGQVAQVAQ